MARAGARLGPSVMARLWRLRLPLAGGGLFTRLRSSKIRALKFEGHHLFWMMAGCLEMRWPVIRCLRSS
jgi:hypothetical protein